LAVLLILSLAALASAGGCQVERAGLRARVLRLHKRAARCGDVDTACVTRLFGKIAQVRRQLAARKCRGGRGGGKQRCSPGTTFRKFLSNRRARISRMAQNCGDEDDACIKQAMNLLVALNSDLKRQRRIWRRSCKPTLQIIVKSAKKIKKSIKVDHFVPRSVWTHEFTCARIQRGFRLWLASKISQRRSFHAESKQCESSDLSCIQQNFRSIIRIQKSIHRGRTLFADRISSCDRCAPIKLRWYRWLKRQRVRRHRLQLAACRCEESDHGCMQRKVDKIKNIQKAIAARRAEALALHGKCLVATTTTSAPVTGIPIEEQSLGDL